MTDSVRNARRDGEAGEAGRPERPADSGVTRREFVGLAAALGVGTPTALQAAAAGAVAPFSSELEPVVVSSLPLASPDRDFTAVRDALRRARTAGVDVAFVPVGSVKTFTGASRNLLRLHRHLDALAGEAVLARRASHLTAAGESGRLAVVPHLEGLQMVVGDLTLVDDLSSGGVGVMALTHNWKNWSGDGCLERTDLPMTGLGELAVKAVTAAGVVLDLSRAGHRTSLHAMEVSRHPVIFSGSNARHVHDHPRNLTDDQIDACAADGGVIGVTAFPTFVAGHERPTLDDLLSHIDYLVERAGAEHVGLGLGFADVILKRFASDPLPNTVPPFPTDLEDIRALPALRHGLERRGYDQQTIAGLLGGNLWRVLEQVWSVQMRPDRH